MKHKLLLITSALMVSAQNRPVYLPTPITVRLSDNDFDVIEIHALQVSPKRELAVMYYKGTVQPVETWDLLKEDQDNAEKMIDAVYDRVMKMFKERGIAA
jgi:hypothetical protein